MKRYFLPILLACMLFLTFPVTAEENPADIGAQMPDEYNALLETLPDQILERLPDGLHAGNSKQVGDALSEMSDFSYLLRTVLNLMGLEVGDCLRMLATVCGLLVLSAVCNALQTSFRSDGIRKGFSMISALVITLLLFSQSYLCIETVTDYFRALNQMTAATLPLSGVLYAMGGNTACAASSTVSLSVYMVIMEELVGKTVVPFAAVCMAFALLGSINGGLRLGTLASTVKKNYTTALTFLMMLLLAMLASQNILGARTDSLAMRSVKFAAGNWIPVVGGSVAELLRTIGAGVGYLRGIAGISGVLLILLLLLPTWIKLFLFRLTWQISASLADLLGCDREKKLMEELVSILGYLIAAVSICSSVLMISMILLANCASAVG